ncbi:hypothetical protein [Aeromonas veronii]|uniref:hypothetical protein n=1 Tax=Aeromonas veronii TaxID=654 RepID=UPI00147D4A7D|nr:hypothetical protein [Aeromonas veronii]
MTKLDWLIRFRRAKTHTTLDFMLDSILNKLESIAEKGEAIRGHELRQNEIDLGQHCRR